jgi:hypothetical protein
MRSEPLKTVTDDICYLEDPNYSLNSLNHHILRGIPDSQLAAFSGRKPCTPGMASFLLSFNWSTQTSFKSQTRCRFLRILEYFPDRKTLSDSVPKCHHDTENFSSLRKWHTVPAFSCTIL